MKTGKFLRRKLIFELIVSVVLLSIILSCGNKEKPVSHVEANLEQEKSALSSECPNVLLISIDTLRADHVHCYGYSRDTTPNIDKLAREGTLFSQAVSPCSWTTPAHMSIFTSSYPIVHHVVNTRSKLAEGRVTLAEVLRKNGYTTGACISAPTMLPADLGFSRGFDLYDDYTVSVDIDLNLFQLNDLYGGQNDHPISPLTHVMVADYLEANYNRKFFLFAHYWDVHGDYAPPSPYSTMFDPDYRGKFNGRQEYINKIQPGIAEEDLNHMIALYDGEIRYVDSYIGMLLAKLEELNLADNTLIILTADHGEEFLEHGGNWHGKTLYDEVVHVPLIIKYPPLIPAGRTISEVVSTINIMPTILDILGIPLKEDVQGKSLFPLITGKGNYDGREVYSETESRIPLKSVRTEEFKFVYNMETQEEELYDLKSDPVEQTNLIDQDTASARLFERKLFNWIMASSRLASSSEASDSAQLDEEAKEKLRALGYLH